MGWITPQLLADVSTDTLVFMDALLQIQAPTWQRPQVALIGDACGCPTLLSGQGASLALAGALHEAATYHNRSG